MRTLTLGIICWALAISTAFGQNSASTQQTGNSNEVTIVQEYQNGSGNTATVNQQ